MAVEHGVVTLDGHVKSWAEKLAVQRAVLRVAGVHDVANDLAVAPLGNRSPNDTEIAHAIRDALRWDVMVPEQRIQSSVADGIVTLQGKVDYQSQRDDAERVAAHVAGVRGLRNEITIEDAGVPVESLKASIEAALERRAVREAHQVAIATAGRQVTVTGRVDSIAERDAIIGAAMGTRGVGQVIDKLVVAR